MHNKFYKQCYKNLLSCKTIYADFMIQSLLIRLSIALRYPNRRILLNQSPILSGEYNFKPQNQVVYRRKFITSAKKSLGFSACNQ